jgi:hypothetical protein
MDLREEQLLPVIFDSLASAFRRLQSIECFTTGHIPVICSPLYLNFVVNAPKRTD